MKVMTLAITSFDGKYMTSYLMGIVMFALTLTIYEIFAKFIKCKYFELRNNSNEQGV